MSGEISIAGKETEEEREGEAGGWISNFIVFASLCLRRSAASISPNKTTDSATRHLNSRVHECVVYFVL